MMIDDNKKIDVLLSALEERYASLHKIRERVQSVCLWALGLLLGAGAWLMQSDVILSALQKAFVIVIILVAFVILRFVYLNDLYKGFTSQQRVAARLEKALYLYAPGIFNDSDKPLYPQEWERAGTGENEGNFFRSTYILLYFGIAFIILAIIFNGWFHHCIRGFRAQLNHLK